MPIRRRTCIRSLRPRSCTETESKNTVPYDGRSSASNSRSKVLFPAPDCPTTETNSSGSMERVTPSSAMELSLYIFETLSKKIMCQKLRSEATIIFEHPVARRDTLWNPRAKSRDYFFNFNSASINSSKSPSSTLSTCEVSTPVRWSLTI